MTPDNGTPSAPPVTEPRRGRAARREWWRWWPLVAGAAAVWAWFAFGVDVLYAVVVTSVAVYALVDALERGRSAIRTAVEAVAWSAGAWLASIALGAVTGWGTGNRVVLGAWGVAAGALIVVLVLVLRRSVRRLD